MLNSLYIRNYAIIRELEVSFQDGFSTITGETGAGKSILLGALSLILGRRADLSVLQNKEEKCIIEGSFSRIKDSLLRVLGDNEIEIAEPIIIRREISPNGKSRAFVNDSPVQLPTLQSIGDLLVDVHSQHENLNLGDNLYQLAVLDAYAGNDELLSKYRGEFMLFSDLNREYEKQLAREAEERKEFDFLSFQYEEIEKAKLTDGELENLEREQDTLQHAEEIKHALLLCSSVFFDEDNGVNSRLKQVELALQKVAGYHKTAHGLKERITSSLIELKDIAREAEQAGEVIEHDPMRQTWVEERLGVIYQLMKKHGQESEAGLIRFGEELKNRLNELESYEIRLGELAKKRKEVADRLSITGKLLSERRTGS
jgi:DNA repair protein RecN (Recombination protein N)